MGDRANVFFVDAKPESGPLTGLYLYTHWAGESLPEIVQSGLERGKGRWGDSQYLARILFCELIKDDVLGETGYGLSTRIGDNGHPIIRVDDTNSRVSFHEEGKETDGNDQGAASWTYEEFVAASLDALQEKYAEAGE